MEKEDPSLTAGEKIGWWDEFELNSLEHHKKLQRGRKTDTIKPKS